MAEAGLNTTPNSTSDEPPYNDMDAFSVHFFFWGIIVPVIVLFGLIGNILTIIVLWRKEMHSTTIYYLRALVLTDTAILIFSFLLLTPISISNYTNSLKYFRDFIYPIIFVPCNYVVMTVQTINVWITVSVTIERYIAICHPFFAIRILTRCKALSVIGVTSVLSVLYNIPRLFGAKASFIEMDDVYSIMTTEYGQSYIYKEFYSGLMYSILIFIIPLLVLFVLNVLLIIELMKMRQRRVGMNVEEDNEANMSLVLVLIVVIFIVCQTPGLIAQYEFLPNNVLLKWLAVSNTLFIFNSSVNFLVYTAVGRKFRKVLFRTVRPVLFKTLGACRVELSSEADTRSTVYELTVLNDQHPETDQTESTCP
ncbi:FMRFamide receptor-like [Argonauta hians]